MHYKEAVVNYLVLFRVGILEMGIPLQLIYV
jgi:hypothetical protein